MTRRRLMHKSANYEFAINPTSIDFLATGGSSTVTVTSLLNGTSIGYSVSSKPSWITVSGTTITATSNTSSSAIRSDSVVFTQIGSGLTATLIVTQNKADLLISFKSTSSYTIPSGYKYMSVLVVGAGDGGAKGGANSSGLRGGPGGGGGGGASGAVLYRLNIPISSTSLSVTVDTAGASGHTPSLGGNSGFTYSGYSFRTSNTGRSIAAAGGGYSSGGYGGNGGAAGSSGGCGGGGGGSASSNSPGSGGSGNGTPTYAAATGGSGSSGTRSHTDSEGDSYGGDGGNSGRFTNISSKINSVFNATIQSSVNYGLSGYYLNYDPNSVSSTYGGNGGGGAGGPGVMYADSTYGAGGTGGMGGGMSQYSNSGGPGKNGSPGIVVIRFHNTTV